MKRILHSIGILFAVFSIFWILMGTTVMFHQVHVYHNHVDLWQVQAININGKDLKKCFRFLDNNPNTPFNADILNQVQSNEFGQVALNLCKKTTFSRYLFDLITSEYNYDRILRGPPVA